MTSIDLPTADLKERIRARYGAAALAVQDKGDASCCASSCCGGTSARSQDPITTDLYDPEQEAAVPDEALAASLGCGNPTALAELRPGEVVLDLGSGGGIDVLLSARRVGPAGKAYGLDMTDEMLALARENQQKAGLTNVEFLKGEIERIPLPEGSVDVVISNCVLNLSTDKKQALSEAFRVLKPGGRFAVSDVVVRGPVPAEVRKSVELWVGCVAGALEEQQYEDLLAEVGFGSVSVEPTRLYKAEDARGFIEEAGLDLAYARQFDGCFMSAFVRAVKPGA